MGVIRGDFQRKLWISLFFVVIWSIWYERDEAVFERKKTDWENLHYLIKLRLGFWLKGWDKKCPFNPGEVVTKLNCVRLWNHHRNPRPLVSWCPPPSNKLKWNVDGSSRGKLGEAGIGGVLRNEFGTIKAKFTASVGIRDSNEAEFMAIVFALELSLQQNWIMEKEIIVESDSKNALSWVKKREECPWELTFFGNKLGNILKILKVTFEHKNWKANDIADSLAKEGAHMEGRWIMWL